MRQVQKIFIYGAPGAGKTTLSRYLKLRLNWPLVEADYLREGIAKLAAAEEDDPFVYVGTKDAYKRFGELTRSNVIKGLKAVRRSMLGYVINEIKLNPEGLILEAAFLDPAEVMPYGRTFLVVTRDDKRHRGQFFRHREPNTATERAFQASRYIQEYLLEEAERLSVPVLENVGSLKELAKRLD